MKMTSSPLCTRLLVEANYWQEHEASAGEPIDIRTALRRAAGLMLVSRPQGELPEEIADALLEFETIEGDRA